MSGGEFISPGSAYYYKGKPRNQESCKQGNWKSWCAPINDVISSDVRKVHVVTNDVYSSRNELQTREIQRKQANSIAVACAGNKRTKASKMFQNRFERSEKFALVKEPKVADQSQVTEQPKVTDETQVTEQAEVINETQVTEQAEITQQAELTDAMIQSSGREVLFPPIRAEFNSCPLPWRYESNYVTSSTRHEDFNRKARGFTGSYASPYGSYEAMIETDEL